MTITRQITERSTCLRGEGRGGNRARPQHRRDRLQQEEPLDMYEIDGNGNRHQPLEVSRR
jgi:hypothetical protein